MTGYVRHAEVEIPHMTSLFRPVAFTAAWNFESAQAFIVVLSMSLTFGRVSRRTLIVGPLAPISTPTVLRMTGILNATAIFARVHTFSSRTRRS
jgi:hypothetical protein